MNIQKNLSIQYANKTQKDFTNLGNKKINEEVRSIISQNENLQRIDEYNKFKKEKISDQKFGSVNIHLKSLKKKKKFITDNEKKLHEFNTFYQQKKLDQKLKQNLLIQQKMQQIYNLKKFAEQSQKLKYPQAFSAQEFQDFQSQKQEIFQNLFKEENDLISVDLNQITQYYKNNITDQQKKNHQLTDFCWKLIFIKLDNQVCPINTKQQEIRINKINKINQQFIEIKLLPHLSNQEKITQIFNSHPDYLNHVTGKCKCYTCQCNLSCKCGFSQLLIFFKINLQTIYENDFQLFENQKKQIQFNNDIASQVNAMKENVSPLNIKVTDELLKSLKQLDYQENKILFINPRFQDLNYKRQNPIPFKTTNQIQYVKQFKQGYDAFNTENQENVLRDLKFLGKTSYSQDFDKKSFHSHGSKFNQAFLSELLYIIKRIPLKYKYHYNIDQKNIINYAQTQKPRIFIAPDNLKTLISFNQNQMSQSQRTFSVINMNRCN